MHFITTVQVAEKKNYNSLKCFIDNNFLILSLTSQRVTCVIYVEC